MTAQCLISFGSNLGQRQELLALAARRIAHSPLVGQSTLGDAESLRTSRLFETPPIGGPGGQEPFLNAIGAFETDATARDVLVLLQQIEQELGRERRQRWDARSIDLDVVLHGELVGGGHGLIVPHPRYTARQFVLQPACDVAAHYRDPRFGWTLRQLADHLSAGVPSLALTGGDLATRQLLCRRLTREHAIRTFALSPSTPTISVVANVPAASAVPASRAMAANRATQLDDVSVGEPIAAVDEPWVSAYVPPLPTMDDAAAATAVVPRLVARLQRTTAATRWPAPHQIWPATGRWPEYRLEIDDIDWAVSEIASALDSMRCPIKPVTEDGNWWL